MILEIKKHKCWAINCEQLLIKYKKWHLVEPTLPEIKPKKNRIRIKNECFRG